MDLGGCRDPTGPAYSERRADAAFVGIALFAFESAIPAVGVGAIVREEDDDGVLGEVEVIEFAEDAADVRVLVFDHGEGAPGFVGNLGFWSGGFLVDFTMFPAIPVVGWGAPWGVWSGEGDVAEERVRLIFFDELEGLIGAEIDDVPRFSVELSVGLEFRVEVFAPVSGGVAEEVLESACVGVVGPLATVVPFSEDTCGVAHGLEMVCEGGFIEVQPFLSERDPFDAGARVVSSGEEFCAGGRADGAHIKSWHLEALGCDAIDVGCLNGTVSGESKIAPACVICEEDNHVRARRVCGKHGYCEEGDGLKQPGSEG